MTIDWIQGDFAYSTFSGFSTNTRIAASDILGNHRFIFSTDYLASIGSLKEINFYLTYLYLTKRPDIGIGIFNWGDYFYYKYEKIMDRDIGAIFYFSYPFTKYARMETGLLSKQEIRKYLESEKKEYKKSNLLFLSYIVDTSSWSWKGPIHGRRGFITLEKSFKTSKDDLDYLNLKIDLRKYLQLSKESTFALRFKYYHSEGKNPEDFFIGGSSTLRGYNYDQFWGSRMLLFNLELRFPFIKIIYFTSPIHLAIRNIGGVLFLDLGSTWVKGEELTFYHRKEKRLGEKFKLSLGIGLRTTLGFFPLRFDYAWKTDLKSSQKPVLEISIGYDY
jgi:outer membrane protein assembly factor BamA